MISVNERIYREELMDNHRLQGKELQAILKDLNTVNNLLGGNEVTINGIKKLLKGIPKEQEVSIADIGCGNGRLLREIAGWGRKKGYCFKLTGIDNNKSSIQIARRECKDEAINFLLLDVLSADFQEQRFDIISTTLTLHHFRNEEIEQLLKNFIDQSTYGLVINDLQRSRIAYYLFYAFSAVFLKTEIARKDGLTSILRAFKKHELQRFSLKLNTAHQEIKWFWAFRYQWILFKNVCKNSAGK